MRRLHLASQRFTMANTELRMMLGNRRLSEDDWTAMLMVLDAIDGDILAVRSKLPAPPAIELWCSWI
jgi:hypothetical protein